MLPLSTAQAAAIGAGLLGLSQRAADLRRHAAACPAEHTALTAEALCVERIALDLTSLIERLSAAGLADKSSPAAPAGCNGQGGSPTRD